MGKTFRNSKRSFDDDYDEKYSNVKNKRKSQKNLRKIRSSKKHYENFDEDENDYSLHYR
jgi:hypothetical protein